MDLHVLTNFFMWCTIINGSLLLLWALMNMTVPGMLYKTQNTFFPMPREKFNEVFYLLIGIFKFMFLIFNLVPFLALLIIA